MDNDFILFRPTVFLGVPRVWEKIMEGMLDKGKNVKGLQKKIAESVKKAGLEHHLEGKGNIMYTLGKKVRLVTFSPEMLCLFVQISLIAIN